MSKSQWTSLWGRWTLDFNFKLFNVPSISLWAKNPRQKPHGARSPSVFLEPACIADSASLDVTCKTIDFSHSLPFFSKSLAIFPRIGGILVPR